MRYNKRPYPGYNYPDFNEGEWIGSIVGIIISMVVIAVCCFLFTSCVDTEHGHIHHEEHNPAVVFNEDSSEIKIIESRKIPNSHSYIKQNIIILNIDGCEYILVSGNTHSSNGGVHSTIIHKENCKNH